MYYRAAIAKHKTQRLSSLFQLCWSLIAPRLIKSSYTSVCGMLLVRVHLITYITFFSLYRYPFPSVIFLCFLSFFTPLDFLSTSLFLSTSFSFSHSLVHVFLSIYPFVFLSLLFHSLLFFMSLSLPIALYLFPLFFFLVFHSSRSLSIYLSLFSTSVLFYVFHSSSVLSLISFSLILFYPFDPVLLFSLPSYLYPSLPFFPISLFPHTLFLLIDVFLFFYPTISCACLFTLFIVFICFLKSVRLHFVHVFFSLSLTKWQTN